MNAEELKRSVPADGRRETAGADPRLAAGEESLRQQQYYAYKHNAFWPSWGSCLISIRPSL